MKVWCVSRGMAGKDQCGLCLSCGAPFAPKDGGVGLYARRGNLSILYIEDKCNTNSVLMEAYDKPCFINLREASHMIHGSHHEAALDYMCHHHKTDEGPMKPVPGAVLPLVGGPFPYYRSCTEKEKGFVAAWDQPPADARVDLDPLWKYIVGNDNTCEQWVRDGKLRSDINVKHPICKSCNALMTQLSYMRYIVGFCSNAARNDNGSVIKESFRGISSYQANKHKAGPDLKNAYGRWKVTPTEMTKEIKYPTRTSTDDPEAPHIAHYLHLCQPFQATATDDPFAKDAWLISCNSVEAGRTMYFQQAWVLLVIVCVATQLEKGAVIAPHRQTHGQHQHYGVLDLYVSYFFWNLCKYNYARELLTSGMNFVQWHQKYFWFATELPGLRARDLPIVGLACYTTVDAGARDLLHDVCKRLMDLYYNDLQPLVKFVTNRFASPITEAEYFAKHYFIPLEAMRTLKRVCDVGVREDNFESALEVVGMRAMLARVMRICHAELLPMLKSFRRSWLQLEIDRVRSKNDGLTMYSAAVIVRLCELLEPPTELPKDRGVLAAVLRGRRCSPWTSVLALREMGAFTKV